MPFKDTVVSGINNFLAPLELLAFDVSEGPHLTFKLPNQKANANAETDLINLCYHVCFVPVTLGCTVEVHYFGSD